MRTFPGESATVGNSIECTPDGGFIVAGYINTHETSEDEGYLIRMTAQGDTLWTRMYGGADSDRFRCVRVTSDGGFVAAGTSESGGHGEEDVWLLRADASGNELWSSRFGGTSWDEGECVCETMDGGFAVVGETCSFGGCDWDVYLIRTDAFGKQIWCKVFPGYDNYWDYGYGIVEADDGGIVIAGASAMNVYTEFDFLLIKVDKSGTTLWTKTYTWSQSDYEYATSICKTQDGGYAIVGYRYGYIDSSVQLLKVDSEGNQLWSQAYATDDFAGAHCVRETADGGFVVAGYSGSTTNPDAYLLRTDAAGKPLWEGKIDNGGREAAHAICQTRDGGYCAIGENRPYGGQGPSDLWVLRMAGEWSGIGGLAQAAPRSPVLGPVRPSPVGAEAAVHLQVPAGQAASLNLYDLTGRLLRHVWHDSGSSSLQQIRFSRSGLPAGVYYLRLETGAGAATRRLAVSGPEDVR